MYRRRDGKLEKKCGKCEKWWPLTKYGKKGQSFQSYCEDCVKQHNSTKTSKADWTSTKEWLDEYTREYNRKHPVDNWKFEMLYNRKTVWDGIPANLTIKALRGG